MKKWLIIIVTLCLFSVLVGFLWGAYVLKINSSIPECRAIIEFNSYDYYYRARLIFNFRVQGNQGLVFYEGPVFKSNKFIGLINRQISFSVSKMPGSGAKRGTVHYIGHEMLIFKKDNVPQNIAEKILPDFFIVGDGAIFFDIDNMKFGAVFTKDNIPMFYCRHKV